MYVYNVCIGLERERDELGKQRSESVRGRKEQ